MSVLFVSLLISYSAGSLSSSPVPSSSNHEVPGLYLRTECLLVTVSSLSLGTHVLGLKVNFAGLGLIFVGHM